MGYRSDLEAAQARASALEKKLASGQSENDALRQEIEALKKPEKPKKAKKRKKAKGPRQAGGLRKLLGSVNIALVVSLLLVFAVLFGAYLFAASMQHDVETQRKEAHALVDAFVNAWAEERYEDAYQLTQKRYQQAVNKERFVQEMKHHPFVRGVRGVSFGEFDRAVLHTAHGDLALKALVYQAKLVALETKECDLLPPTSDALTSGHRFMAALIDKRFEDARQVTHPLYRESVAAERFAEILGQNIWLSTAIGFKLDLPHGEGAPANEMRGQLLTGEDSVGLVLNFTRGGAAPRISEMIIGGKPSLPTP